MPSPNPNLNYPVSDPGDWLDVMVRGWEVDPIDIPIIGPIGNTGRASLDVTALRLERAELLALIGRSTSQVLPLLTGTRGEYAVTVQISIE